MANLYDISIGKETTNNININKTINNTNTKVNKDINIKNLIKDVKFKVNTKDMGKEDSIEFTLDDINVSDLKSLLYAKSKLKSYRDYKIASFKHQTCKDFDPLFHAVPRGFENPHNQQCTHLEKDANYNKPLFKLHVFHNTTRQVSVILPGNVVTPAVHKYDLLWKWRDTTLVKNGMLAYKSDNTLFEEYGPDLPQIFGLKEADPKGIVICTEYEIRRDNLEIIDPGRYKQLGNKLINTIYHLYNKYKDEYTSAGIENIMFNRDVSKDIADYVTRCLVQGDNDRLKGVKVAAFRMSCETDKAYETKEAVTPTQFKAKPGEDYTNIVNRLNYTDSVKFRLLFYIPESDFENESLLKLDDLGICIANGNIDVNRLGEATYKTNPYYKMLVDAENNKGNTYQFKIVTHTKYPVRYYTNIGNRVCIIDSKTDLDVPEGIYLMFLDSCNNLVSPDGCIPLSEAESVGLYLNREDAESNANIDKRLEEKRKEIEQLKLEIETSKIEADKYKTELEHLKSLNNIKAEELKSKNMELDYDYKIKNNELDLDIKVEKHKIDTELQIIDKDIDIRTDIFKSKINVIDAVTKSSVKNAYETADKLIKLKQQSSKLEQLAEISKNTGGIIKVTGDILKLFY